jgi:hypothetical protein
MMLNTPTLYRCSERMARQAGEAVGLIPAHSQVTFDGGEHQVGPIDPRWRQHRVAQFAQIYSSHALVNG